MQKFKSLLFYKGAKLLGSLIKDAAAKEEFFELCSELWCQDGLF